MAFNLEARFTADAARFNRTIAAMETRFSRFTREVRGGLSKVNSMAGSVHAGLEKVALASAAAGLGVGLVGKNIIDTGADFEAALSSVAAVSGATGEELDKLKSKAMELGSSTKFSGTEVVGAMEAMVKAGFKVDETLAGVGGILSAAAADGGTIEETSASIMASMKGLGLGPEKMQGFADMLAKAGDSTAASIGTLTESMGKFGPVARQLGIPLESSIAQLALLQDAGIDASSAGTTLAATYSKLAAPVGATKDAIKKLGIEIKDATTGNMKAPDELLAEIIGATDGIKGNVGKMAAITNLVGLESQKALLNIAAAAKDGKLKALTEDLKKAGGYADEIAAKRLNNFKGDVTILGSAIDGVKIKLFDLNKGPLREVAQGMTTWVKANEGLITSKAVEYIDTIRKNLPEIVMWAKRIGIGLVVFYGLAAAVKVATVAVAAFEVASKVAAFTGRMLTSQIVARTAAFGASTVATGAATVATWASTAASKALNVALYLGQLATTRVTAATIASSAASGLNTVATWARNAAHVAHNAVTKTGAMLTGAYAAATSGSTLKSIANTAAMVAGKVAQVALNAARGVASGVLGVYAIARGRATAAEISGTAATVAGAGAMKAMAVSAGAAAAALGAVMLAMDQADKLSKETGGLGVTGLVGEMWERGTFDPFEAYDAKMNEEAIAKAKNRAPKASPLVVGPQERGATQVVESRTSHTEETEVTIKTPPGTDAKVTKQPKGNTRLRVAQSGGL